MCLWILLLARDVNRISKRDTFNLKILSVWVGLLFIIAVGLTIALLSRQILTAPVQQTVAMAFLADIAMAASVLLFVTVCALAIAIHRFVLLREGKKNTAAAMLKITFMTFLMYLSLPYLQTRLNDLQLRLPHPQHPHV